MNSSTNDRHRAAKYSQWFESHFTLRSGRHKITWVGASVLFLLAIIAGSLLSLMGVFSGLGGSFSGAGTGGGLGTQPGNYPLTGQIQDAQLGSALGATTTIDVIVPAINGWSKPWESPTQTSSTYTTRQNMPSGTVFYLHVVSTAGNRYYDQLFGPYTAGRSPWLVGSTTTCNNCVWSQGTTLGLYQMTNTNNVRLQLTDSRGSLCASATAAASSTQSTDTAGMGAVTMVLTLNIQVSGTTSTSVTNYGVPMPIITSTLGPPGPPGPGSSTLQLVAFYATNQTTGDAWISQNGWTTTTTQRSPATGTIWYKVLPAMISTKTGGASMTVQIPLDLTSGPGAGRRVQTALWISDLQLPSDSAQASPNGAPTAYGAYSTVGPNGLGWPFTSFSTSAGRWTGYQINCGVTQ